MHLRWRGWCGQHQISTAPLANGTADQMHVPETTRPLQRLQGFQHCGGDRFHRKLSCLAVLAMHLNLPLSFGIILPRRSGQGHGRAFAADCKILRPCPQWIRMHCSLQPRGLLFKLGRLRVERRPSATSGRLSAMLCEYLCVKLTSVRVSPGMHLFLQPV